MRLGPRSLRMTRYFCLGNLDKALVVLALPFGVGALEVFHAIRFKVP